VCVDAVVVVVFVDVLVVDVVDVSSPLCQVSPP
jgi:hypothetical protein